MTGFAVQRGVVLVTVLVFLLVMMLLGLSTMRDAGVEERMSGADRRMQLSFQMADTGIDEVLVDPGLFVAGGSPLAASTGMAGPHGSGANLEISYVGATDLPAGSNSSNVFRAHHFRVRAEGVDRAESLSGGQLVISPEAVVSVVERGAWKLGP